MNTYELIVTARCPVQPSLVDVYNAKIESEEMIGVETILQVFLDKQEITIFQEDLAKYAAGVLSAKVTLTGHHSGVKTTSIYDRSA